MESARVRVVRDAVQINPLLIRPKVGKPMTRGMILPGPDFVYGTMNTVYDGGVREAISHWYTPSPHKKKKKKKKAERDFVALNRESVKSGLVTAKEHTVYRATHDIRRAEKLTEVPQGLLPIQFPPDMTFGICTRPTTSIADLIEHKFRRLWIEEQRLKQKALLPCPSKKRLPAQIPETRTSLLRKFQPITDPPSLWKMPRFLQVGPTLDTFRDSEARKKAFAAHFSDGVARQGLLSQGTYNVV